MTNNNITILLDDSGDAPYGGKGLKVPHGSTLSFLVPCGSSVANFPLELYTNYPTQPNTQFDRNNFHCIRSETYNGHSDWIVNIEVNISGCFSYYILSGGITKCKQGHFYVDPVLTIQGQSIPPEGIILQTVLPKCLGSFDKWEEQLAYSSKSGYNMIHFTPVQELGSSQSSYSIYDQLKLNSKLFPQSTDEERWFGLAHLIKTLETKYGMLSMTDLVWNHTADNSPWLVEHPEAGYNLENSPHLKSAYDFDEAIMQFSKSVEGTLIQDEGALAVIRHFTIKSETFPLI